MIFLVFSSCGQLYDKESKMETKLVLTTAITSKNLDICIKSNLKLHIYIYIDTHTQRYLKVVT